MVLDRPTDSPFSRNKTNRNEREREFNNLEQGFKLKQISDLISEHDIARVSEGVLNKTARESVDQALSKYKKPFAYGLIGFILLQLIIMAYFPEASVFAKNALKSAIELIKQYVFTGASKN